MAYSLNIFLCVILAFVFAMLIFVVNLTLTHSSLYKKTDKWKYLQIAIQIVIGFIFGLSYSLFFYLTSLSPQADSRINVIFVIGIILPTLLYESFWLGIGSTSMLLITNYLFNGDTNVSIQLFITIAYVAYFALIVIGSLIFKRIRPLLKNIIILFIFFVLQIIYFVLIFKFDNKSNIFILRNVIATEIIFFVYLLINCLSFNYINKIYSKTLKIVDDIAFENKFFISESLWESKVTEFISENNMQYGYLIGINIENIHLIPESFSENDLSLLNDNIGEAIHDYFKKDNAIFFKHNENFFCFLLTGQDKIHISEFDYKKQTSIAADSVIERLNKLPFNIVPFKRESVTFKPKLKIVYAVYGIHSNVFSELLSFCDNMISSVVDSSPNSSLHSFNPLRQGEDQEIIHKYIQLSNAFDTTKIQIILRSYTYREYDISTPNFAYPSRLIFRKRVLIKSVPEYFHDVLIRHLAVKTIQQFSMQATSDKNLLMLHYPVESISSPFYSVEKFCYKVRWMGLKTEQIILDFNLDYLGLDQLTFISNIHKLHQSGVKISVRNITAETIDLVKKIKPFISFYKTFDSADFEQNKEYNILMQRLLKKAKINYFN